MLQAGCCIGGTDQILEELEGGIEAQGGGGPQEVDAVGVNSIATSENEISRFKGPPSQAYARFGMQLYRVIDKRRILVRKAFRSRPLVIVRQDESRSDGVGKSTGRWSNVELRVEVGQPAVGFVLLTVHLKAQSQTYGESPRDLPVVDREKMGRSRTQSDVRHGG